MKKSRSHRFPLILYSGHLVFFRTYLIIGVLLVLPHAQAAEPTACAASMDRISYETAESAFSSENPDAIEFEVGALQAQFGSNPTALMTGGVVLRQGSKVAGADSARYDPDQRALFLEGAVRYEDSGTQIASDSAEFAYDFGRIRFEGAEFSLGSNNARGAADALEINERGRLELDGVSYSTCPPGSNDWLLQADQIVLDTRAGVGTARGIKLRFKSVPIFYAPYMSFPISDARKSGVLTPEIGSTGRSGNEIRVPYYWNIAPNIDATITPRLLTDRGLQMQTQFRYLTEAMRGRVDAEYLASDSILNDSRHMLRLRHLSLFSNGWRNRIDFREVSDSQYFEDLGGSLSQSSITHLDRSLSFDYHTDSLSFFGQIQDFQTIDDAIIPSDEPYRRLPQLLVQGKWPNRWLGLRYGLSGELVNFDRNIGVTGWRLNVAPKVELPIARPGWFVTPGVTVDYTRYALSNTLPGQQTKPSRTLPIASLDTGLVLERTMIGSNRIQTLEPRFLFVHVPYREQSGLPVFDTITPDLNLVQLYRKNRFLGVDRIADTDQISFGITSRIVDVSTGKELVSATIGQTRYLSESGVSLPGQPVIAEESSDYIAEVRFLIHDNLNFDIGHQWGSAGSGTTQSEARLQYRPASNKILNLAYRFRRESLEQGDVSWSWPISSNWNFVGRYNFSFRDRETLEEFFGLEYESCCWGLRLVSRRHISTRDGTRDSSFGLQLILKGMTSVGTAADKLLERGILGYSADLR
ncbi:MAG: LPS assembly protein LptD [Proteobacteria bacterium]|nr:LPS assembly protein LptD [Pseudomonadota bacterium]